MSNAGHLNCPNCGEDSGMPPRCVDPELGPLWEVGDYHICVHCKTALEVEEGDYAGVPEGDYVALRIVEPRESP